LAQQSEVLAIKYRPKRFEDLIGQDTISQTLSLALSSKRLSHAYLFSGLRGSGKTSTARIFAKALTCEHGPTSSPCDKCEQCVMANENRHIDVIEMDAASSRKIDDIRDLIEHTKYKPAAARFKIFIIDEVHMLTKEAFNALLKTLEEPPPFVKFILATTDPLKLPATILSRTQHFRFKRIPQTLIVNHLAHILNLEQINFEQEALEILARSGSGSLRDTLTLLDQAIIYSKQYVDVQTVTQMLGLIDPAFIDSIFDAVFAKDRIKITKMVQELQEYDGEMVVDELIAYLKEKLFTHDIKFPTMIQERFLHILSDSKSLFYINADSGFVLLLLFSKMMEALKLKEIDEVIAELEDSSHEPQIKIVQPTVEPIKTTKIEQYVKEEEQPQSEIPKEVEQPSIKSIKDEKFEKLIARLIDRNVDLGECFKESVNLISFEENRLTWQSCAEENCKKVLRNGYSIIKFMVQEIWGMDVKIANTPCDEVKKKPEIVEEKPQIVEEEKQPEPTVQEPDIVDLAEEDDPNSNGCVSNCSAIPAQIDAKAMLEEPMVQRAKELFNAKRIVVQSKV